MKSVYTFWIGALIVLGACMGSTNEPPKPVTVLESKPTNLIHTPTAPITVRWQLDPIRYNNWLVEQDELFAAQFYKTNTDAGKHVIRSRYLQPIRVTTNDVELGYVSNGAVVWRVPPEAKP